MTVYKVFSKISDILKVERNFSKVSDKKRNELNLKFMKIKLRKELSFGSKIKLSKVKIEML